MKKITFLFVLIFSLTSCASVKILSGYSIILPKNKEENLDKLIEFYGDVENTSDENSYLKEINLLEKITNPVKGIKLLETEIVIETNKKYFRKKLKKRRGNSLGISKSCNGIFGNRRISFSRGQYFKS